MASVEAGAVRKIGSSTSSSDDSSDEDLPRGQQLPLKDLADEKRPQQAQQLEQQDERQQRGPPIQQQKPVDTATLLQEWRTTAGTRHQRPLIEDRLGGRVVTEAARKKHLLSASECTWSLSIYFDSISRVLERPALTDNTDGLTGMLTGSNMGDKEWHEIANFIYDCIDTGDDGIDLPRKALNCFEALHDEGGAASAPSSTAAAASSSGAPVVREPLALDSYWALLREQQQLAASNTGLVDAIRRFGEKLEEQQSAPGMDYWTERAGVQQRLKKAPPSSSSQRVLLVQSAENLRLSAGADEEDIKSVGGGAASSSRAGGAVVEDQNEDGKRGAPSGGLDTTGRLRQAEDYKKEKKVKEVVEEQDLAVRGEGSPGDLWGTGEDRSPIAEGSPASGGGDEPDAKKRRVEGLRRE